MDGHWILPGPGAKDNGSDAWGRARWEGGLGEPCGARGPGLRRSAGQSEPGPEAELLVSGLVITVPDTLEIWADLGRAIIHSLSLVTPAATVCIQRGS